MRTEVRAGKELFLSFFMMRLLGEHLRKSLERLQQQRRWAKEALEEAEGELRLCRSKIAELRDWRGTGFVSTSPKSPRHSSNRVTPWDSPSGGRGHWGLNDQRHAFEVSPLYYNQDISLKSREGLFGGKDLNPTRTNKDGWE
jgi:hypothetical protein